MKNILLYVVDIDVKPDFEFYYQTKTETPVPAKNPQQLNENFFLTFSLQMSRKNDPLCEGLLKCSPRCVKVPKISFGGCYNASATCYINDLQRSRSKKLTVCWLLLQSDVCLWFCWLIEGLGDGLRPLDPPPVVEARGTILFPCPPFPLLLTAPGAPCAGTSKNNNRYSCIHMLRKSSRQEIIYED